MENETLPIPMTGDTWDYASIAEYNEYLDWLGKKLDEEQSQELPEDFRF